MCMINGKNVKIKDYCRKEVKEHEQKSAKPWGCTHTHTHTHTVTLKNKKKRGVSNDTSK